MIESPTVNGTRPLGGLDTTATDVATCESYHPGAAWLGSFVHEIDVVLEMDRTVAQAEVERLTQQNLDLEARLAALEAGRNTVAPDPTFVESSGTTLVELTPPVATNATTQPTV